MAAVWAAGVEDLKLKSSSRAEETKKGDVDAKAPGPSRAGFRNSHLGSAAPATSDLDHHDESFQGWKLADALSVSLGSPQTDGRR